MKFIILSKCCDSVEELHKEPQIRAGQGPAQGTQNSGEPPSFKR